MVAAKIPAITNPANKGGKKLVDKVIKIFSAEVAVRYTEGYKNLPTIPINTAIAKEIITHTIAILLENFNSSSLRIAIKRRST